MLPPDAVWGIGKPSQKTEIHSSSLRESPPQDHKFRTQSQSGNSFQFTHCALAVKLIAFNQRIKPIYKAAIVLA